MRVILLERVAGLGNVGDEVTVRPGYARNYLIPQGKACEASEGNRKIFERRRAQLEKQQQERLEKAKALAAELAGLSLKVVRATSDGKHLYGSVSVYDLADLLREKGYSVDRSNILLDETIKEVGEYAFRVRLHPDVTADLTIVVESEKH